MDPHTAAMPNIAEKMPPVSSIPTQPSGEIANRARNASGRVVSNTGAWVADSRIGRNASDTSTDGITNRVKPEGSATFSRAWLAMMPIICTIM